MVLIVWNKGNRHFAPFAFSKKTRLVKSTLLVSRLIRYVQDLHSCAARGFWPAVVLGRLVLGSMPHKLLDCDSIDLGIPKVAGKCSAEVVPGNRLGELGFLAALLEHLAQGFA